MGRAGRAAAALALGLGLSVLAPTAPVAAGEVEQTFQVTPRTINDSETDGGPPGPSAGDTFSFTERLFRGGERVGRDAVTCKIKRFERRLFEAQCFVTMVFTDRGQITAQGLVTFRRGSDRRPVLAITGGTGEFEDAGGRFVIVEERDKPTRYRIHLTQDPPPAP